MELIRLGSSDFEAIGKTIKEVRKDLKIRQIDMADEIGVGRNVIHKIEKGKGSLSVEYLYYISQILGKSMDYLVTKRESQEADKVGKGIYFDAGRVEARLHELISGRSYEELHMIEKVVNAVIEEGDR